jgi:hypothetical protein
MFSRYRLRRLLGQGGMGVVWLAHDSNLDRPVALKFLPEAFLQDPVARDDMKNETRRSLQLTHPNVVRIYDFLEDGEAAAISMEYVDGSTLSHIRVERSQRCFEAEGLHAWVADLCCAMEYAHRDACVVHRDLKPANLMVTSRGSLKIADFGIARSLRHTAARVSGSSSGGTLGYMSPQQLAGELASASDDIYSIGATLYELLTSKPPFYSGDLSLQIRSIAPERMADRRLQLGVSGEPIPDRWEDTIAACLSKKIVDRPATAREVAALLGIELQRTQPPSPSEAPTLAPRLAQPPSKLWIAPLRGISRKHAVVSVSAGVALLAAIALWPHRRATPARGPLAALPVTNTPSPTVAPVVEPKIGFGGLMVKTSPAGATVVVDGKAAGATPLSMPDLREGAHSVEIALAGFDTVSTEAPVRPNQFTDLGLITLQRSVGTLQITSQPEGSDYALFSAEGDHEIRRGQTPDSIPQLPTGDYRLRVTRPGWPPQDQTITVEREATRIVSNRFGIATLQVATDPPGAEIFSDGKSLGVTPLRVELPNGRYENLMTKLADFQPESFSADLILGETVAVPPMVLKPVPPSLSITTNPRGIEFQILSGTADGASPEILRTGETPVNIDGLPSGAYRMNLGGGRWPSRSVPFQIGERGKTTFSQDFPHGTVAVESQPPGAEIYEGDTLLGTTPASIALPPGSHTLVGKIEGRKPAPRAVEIVADETKTLRVEFKTDSAAAASVGSGEGLGAHHRHRRRRRAPESELTKIGRTIKHIFFGKHSRQ